MKFLLPIRLHNKSVYFKIGLRKMVNRSTCRDLHKKVVVEADGRVLDLPPLEGIVVLNILSWGGGANPWGPENDENFARPTHYDGLLEVVGICGVLHMGQIYSGLRSGIRLTQAAHVAPLYFTCILLSPFTFLFSFLRFEFKPFLTLLGLIDC